MQAVSEPITHTQYLTFQLAGEEYAINILRVREIIDFDIITKVPRTPEFVRGVINLRGSVVPVIDLAAKLGLPESAVTIRSCIVIVEPAVGGNYVLMGIVADEVSEVLDLMPQDVEPPPAFDAHITIDYLFGIGKVDRRFVLILDIDRILSPKEMASAASLSEAPEQEE